MVEEKKKEQDPSRMTDLVDNDLFAFDDDVFTASKEKQEISISNIEYQAKIDTDGVCLQEVIHQQTDLTVYYSGSIQTNLLTN